MTKLLYIEASPRKENSYSSQVANEFLESYKAANPDHEIEHLPLFETELEPFAMEGANQKMDNIINLMGGGSGIEPTGEWAGVMREIERLKSADKVLLSAPMWNYSIGQITDRPLQMVLASGSPYEERFPLETDGIKIDFQRAYLDHIFRFLGFTDIRLIKVQPTGMPGPDLDAVVANARVEAEKAAKAF